MRIKMLQRIGDRLEQLLGLRGIAALIFQTIDAKSKFSDAIFGLCNPLGYIDEIRRNAPHVVYPLLIMLEPIRDAGGGSSGSLCTCE